MKKLALLLLAFSSMAFADDRWAVYGVTKNNEKNYVDTQTALETDDGFIVWTKELGLKCSKSDTNGSCYAMNKQYVNCSDVSITYYESNLYRKSDNKLLSSSSGEQRESIIPDSLGEKLFNATCK